MKYIKLLIAAAFVSVFTISCDQDLPYPLDDVKRGVVIDVVRSTNTDGVLSAGTTDGNYKITISIPPQQGNYSQLDYVQLLCVYTDPQGKTTAKVIEDNIKDFPKEITLNIADIYTKLGLTEPSLGEVCEITTNSVLKDGYVVYGWNEYSGFNNKAFTGWVVDGRAYSYRVRYPVACQLVLDDFVGTMTMTDNSVFYGGGQYSVTCVKISETELEIVDFFEDSNLRIVIDPTVHTVTVPKQVLYPTFGSYTNFYVSASGTIDACNTMITFGGTVGVDQGTYQTNANWVLRP